LKKGVAWPSPRFTLAVAGSGVVITDNLTGLMWASDGNAPGPVACTPGTTKAWQAALDYVACLNTNSYLGYTDWRLPNVIELESLGNMGEVNSATWLNGLGFTNVQPTAYWSSTTVTSNTAQAWSVFMDVIEPFAVTKSVNNYVLPVRTGQNTTPPAMLPQTGQLVSYDTNTASPGDDGALKKGFAWPTTRFTLAVAGSGVVVTDNLTSLMWTRDGNTPGPVGCGPATAKTWQAALDYAACLNTNSYLGYTDWRLPNIKELRSLANAGESNTTTWLIARGFTNVLTSPYWSSTTTAANTGNAYYMSLIDGAVGWNTKASAATVWPVRGGQ